LWEARSTGPEVREEEKGLYSRAAEKGYSRKLRERHEVAL